MDPGIWFLNVCRKNNLHMSETQIKLFEEYVAHLIEWNKKINLISRRDEENIWQRHILASISFLFRFRIISSTRMIDIGTGGGLPGIPLAIIHQDIEVILVDSIHKKIDAVKDIIRRLHLNNVSAICSRAEELASQKNFTHSMDYVIARAVAPTKDLITWGESFLHDRPINEDSSPSSDEGKVILPKGSLLLLKGGELTGEVNEARTKLKPRQISVYPLAIDGVDQSECSDKKLVVVLP